MKEHKVLSVIYGIALFAALLGVVGLLYNAIEMLINTTFFEYSYRDGYTLMEEFHNIQKPIAIAIMIASVIGIVGIGGAVAYLFIKKPPFKLICLSCIAVVILVILATLIAICVKWNTYYSTANFSRIAGSDKIHFIGNNLDSSAAKMAQAYTLYSTALASVIENLVCYTVVAALMVYDFIKNVRCKKKAAVTEEVKAEEITE